MHAYFGDRTLTVSELMEGTIRRSAIEFLDQRRIWNKVAWVVWTVVLVVVVLRPFLLSHRGTSFDTYQLAGSHWLRGEDVYSQWMGFVYSPLVAAFFAPFAWLPVSLANILWRILNAALLLGGLAAILKIQPLRRDQGKKFWPAVYPPGSAGDRKYRYQSGEPAGGGIAVTGDRRCLHRALEQRGNLRCNRHLFQNLSHRRRVADLPDRTQAFQLADADRPFAAASHPVPFQHWSYVSSQYHAWIATRTSDDRRQWPVEKLPLDLWFLIHWVWHLPIPPKVYSAIQLGTAGALALFCAVQTWKGWAKNRILIGLFCLVSIWMTLCGPATESYTYLILAPAMVLALVQAFAARQPALLRALISAAFILQLLAATRASFLPHFKPFWALSVLPFSALLFLAYTLLWLFNASLWPEARFRSIRGEAQAGPSNDHNL